MKKLMKNRTMWTLAAIMLAGLILRVIACFWGYPHPLHGDEPTTVYTVYDGYSPLEMNGSTIIPTGLDKNGNLIMPADKPHAQYLIVSSGMYNRFYAEPDRYAFMINMYEKIDESCELIYESEVFVARNSKWSAVNMVYKVGDIIESQGKCTGSVVKIYKRY